jgi:hypothetical protein
MRTSNTTAAVPVATLVARQSDRGRAILRIQKLAEMTIAHGATANEQKVARSKARFLIGSFDLGPQDVFGGRTQHS